MTYKSQFYGFTNKITNTKRNCFRFSEIVKLTNKIHSSISDLDIFCYLELPMPIMYGKFME